MNGFKDFLLRGNLIELAVAFIMAAAFAKVVTAMVNLIMDLIGKVGGTPNFSDYAPGGVHVGALLTALVSFVILAAVVYYAIVLPYTKAVEFRNRDVKVEADPTELELLVQIRDELRARQN
ncbi:MAG: MscL family protein [Allobranchiibius sp.]